MMIREPPPPLRAKREVRLRLDVRVHAALRMRALKEDFAGDDIAATAAALIAKALELGECRACGRLFRQASTGPLLKACEPCRERAARANAAAAAMSAAALEEGRA